MTETVANQLAMSTFAALDLRSIALLFDVDGTLVDIGPSPFEVKVPEALKNALGGLSGLTGGALALVSGRPIRDIDALFAPLMLPAIGGHGAEIRLAGGAAVARIENLPKELRQLLVAAAPPGSGVDVEDKGYSVALHYRRAPAQAERLRHHVAASRAAFPAEKTELLLGKAMLEVKRPGIDKGEAVRELMRHPPFAGRVPVFVGDDVTVETVFRLLPMMGGKGFSVGRHFENVTGTFASPEEVRRTLLRLSANVAGAP